MLNREQEPFYLPGNSSLDVTMWRETDGRKVWYEWMVEAFLDSRVEGEKKGKQRRMRLGCSAVGSSREGGCLM